MNVKFSVDRRSPAGPMLLAHVAYAGFVQTVSLTPDQGREIYRGLGDALLEAGKAVGNAAACAACAEG